MAFLSSLSRLYFLRSNSSLLPLQMVVPSCASFISLVAPGIILVLSVQEVSLLTSLVTPVVILILYFQEVSLLVSLVAPRIILVLSIQEVPCNKQVTMLQGSSASLDCMYSSIFCISGQG